MKISKLLPITLALMLGMSCAYAAPKPTAQADYELTLAPFFNVTHAGTNLKSAVSYDDTYIFKYDKCGRVGNRLVDYINVVCFHNTRDIITVLPVNYGENLPHVDLNYMIEDKPQKEIKRVSAVEKFNKRFKR